MRMHRAPPELVVGLFLGILCLFLGCSDTDRGTTPSEETVLKIGTLFPLSGSLSTFGPSQQRAAQLALDHIHSTGGVLGNKVVMEQRDSGTDSTRALPVARVLIEEDGITALVGPDASRVTLAVCAITVPNQVILISPASTSPMLTEYEDHGFLWRTCASDAAQGAFMAEQAYALGFQTASILYQDNVYGQGIHDAFEAAFSRLGGTILQSVPFNVDQSSHILELNALFAQPPDVVVLATFVNNARIILKEAKGLSLRSHWILSEAMYQESLFSVGDVAEGVYVVSVSSEGVQRSFVDLFRAEYNGEVPLTFSAQTYDAVMLLALAAEKAGETSGRALRDALQTVSAPPGERIGIGPDEFKRAVQLLRSGQDINYEGASGPIDFDEQGDVTATSYQLWQVQGSTFVEVGP